jgi:hypothetical protein
MQQPIVDSDGYDLIFDCFHDSLNGQKYIEEQVSSNNYSLHLASGSSYTLTLYNDALLAGDDKQVTATFTLSYD